MLDPAAQVVSITETLYETATPERAAQEKRYLKSSLKFIGVTMPTVNALAKRFAKEHKDLAREELLALVDALWRPGIHELRSFAIESMCLFPKLMEPEDLPMLERFIRESAGWAHVDEISARVVGDIVSRHPTSQNVLDRWATDPDFWVRRASMLTLLLPLRKGDLGEWDRFARYAESMIEEKEFFIRKAIGWILRETSKKNSQPVIEFLKLHKGRASGLTFREGSKYLPPGSV